MNASDVIGIKMICPTTKVSGPKHCEYKLHKNKHESHANHLENGP